MKNNFTKGKANCITLADRMKNYESVTCNQSLIKNLPVYARIDMRAGHSFCKKLNKPFDICYSNAMKEATKYLVDKTGAKVGYTQSDEASFVWTDSSKMPFETRLFKLQSVYASMFTSAFIKACIGTKLEYKVFNTLPSFDCRIMNLPSLMECFNMLMWRENDSVKNSISLLALEHYSNKELYKKNSSDKINMLKDKNIDYYSVLSEDLRNGAYFRRECYDKELTEDELKKIPEKQKETLSTIKNSDNTTRYFVTRSHIIQFFIGKRLTEIPIDERIAVFF